MLIMHNTVKILKLHKIKERQQWAAAALCFRVLRPSVNKFYVTRYLLIHWRNFNELAINIRHVSGKN